MKCVLRHQPRCSKSRRALELLREAGAASTVRVYMDAPRGAAEHRAALTRPGATAGDRAVFGRPPELLETMREHHA